jgi:hypothetical protein
VLGGTHECGIHSTLHRVAVVDDHPAGFQTVGELLGGSETAGLIVRCQDTDLRGGFLGGGAER